MKRFRDIQCVLISGSPGRYLVSSVQSSEVSNSLVLTSARNFPEVSGRLRLEAFLLVVDSFSSLQNANDANGT
jgi:hypothetical protein